MKNDKKKDIKISPDSFEGYVPKRQASSPIVINVTNKSDNDKVVYLFDYTFKLNDADIKIESGCCSFDGLISYERILEKLKISKTEVGIIYLQDIRGTQVTKMMFEVYQLNGYSGYSMKPLYGKLDPYQQQNSVIELTEDVLIDIDSLWKFKMNGLSRIQICLFPKRDKIVIPHQNEPHE